MFGCLLFTFDIDTKLSYIRHYQHRKKGLLKCFVFIKFVVIKNQTFELIEKITKELVAKDNQQNETPLI